MPCVAREADERAPQCHALKLRRSPNEGTVEPLHRYGKRATHKQVSRETLRVPNVSMLCSPVTMPALIVLTGH